MNYRDLTVPYTYSTLVDGFRTVTVKLQNLRNKITVPDSDGRQVGLYGMQEVLTGFGLTAHAISGAGLTTRQRTVTEVKESFANYVTIKGKTQEDLLKITETVWRWSLLTLFHFKLDALFQNLLRAFGTNPGRTGFGQNASNLLDRVTLPNVSRSRDVLAAFTHIRNSLHNNGIHRGKDWGPFQSHGLTYEFREDYDVPCATFGHVLAILDTTVDVLTDILLSPEVMALPVVEDRYVVLNPN